MLKIIKKYIQKFKDWKWEFWHTKIHKRLALLFTLTDEERLKLSVSWKPKIGQDAVYIDDDSIKQIQYHKPNFNWTEESRKMMVWFDDKGRYIKNDYFPDYFFRNTFKVGKIENDAIYSESWEMFEECKGYPKNQCLPILTKREFRKMFKR
jgi:hypothetical protein